MSRQAVTKEYNTFIKGIITEASPLTFPENASIDEENFVLNRNGSRQRRLGVDYEDDYTLVDTSNSFFTMEYSTISTYRWDNVSNDADISLAVVQVGNKIYFADVLEEDISSNLKNSGNPITLSTSGTKEFQYTAINGVLVVTTGETKPFYLSYNSSTDTISITYISPKIRDLFGVDDGLTAIERPSVLSNLHRYNLKNQGWSNVNINAVGYPSNADVQHLGKDSSDDFQYSHLQKQFFGTTPAPKGKYIINAFTRGASREAETAIATGKADIELGFFSTLTTHSSRVFYAGVQSKVNDGDSLSPDYTGFVFYTKIINNLGDLGKYYSEADPSSEHVFDLIATDGGFIPIPDASIIYKIVSYANSIIVFADNGVWRIFSTEKAFTATDQELERVTNVGAINAGSVVVAEDVIYYWSKGGIYAITPEEISGKMVAKNISINTIHSLYVGIQEEGKANVKGNYDVTNKKVSWLYNNESTYNGTTFKNKYNRELIFDTVPGAFNKNKIEDLTSDSPYVAGHMPTQNFLMESLTQAIVHDGTQVVVNGENVVLTTSVKSDGTGTTKFLMVKPDTTYSFTFGSYKNRDFLDWKTDDSTGITYLSYLNTGHEIHGDSMRVKQVPYIFFHFNRTEDGYETVGSAVDFINPSSCMVQARWEWSDSNNSGRWGSPFQAYRLKRYYIPSGVTDTFDYGFEVISTKSKLRGKGKALSLYIYSEEGKDMQLLGWAISASGGSIP